MKRILLTSVFALGAVAISSGIAHAGAYQTVDLSNYVNVPFTNEFGGSTFPLGAQTFNNVPFVIANVSNGTGGYNNFWTGGGASSALVSAPATTPTISSLTVPLGNVMNVTHVYSMINTLWGAVGVPNILQITFNAGNGAASYTQDLIDGTNVRDYNLIYGDQISSPMTQQAFSNGQGQVLDMQDYTLPSYFATDGLRSVTLTQDGAPHYEEAMFNGLTLQMASPPTTPAPEPGSLAILSTGLIALGFTMRKRQKRY